MKIVSNQPEAPGKKYARKRAGDGDVEFLLGVVGLARDSCEAAENEKGDGSYGDAVELCDRAMAQLMKDHGSEKQDAGDDAERPMLCGRPAFMLRSELGSQRESGQEKNDEPAGVHVNGDAENTSDAKTCRGRRIAGRYRRWAGCRSHMGTARGCGFV